MGAFGFTLTLGGGIQVRCALILHGKEWTQGNAHVEHRDRDETDERILVILH